MTPPPGVFGAPAPALVHTTFCVRIAAGLRQDPDVLDPEAACQLLHADLLALGHTWHDYDPVDLINVVESHGPACTHGGDYLWHLAALTPRPAPWRTP